jgi:hypothetical protein
MDVRTNSEVRLVVRTKIVSRRENTFESRQIPVPPFSVHILTSGSFIETGGGDTPIVLLCVLLCYYTSLPDLAGKRSTLA